MAGGTAHGLNPLAVPFVSNEAASTGVKTIRSALPDDGTIAAVVVSVGRLIELPADLLALVIRRLGLSDIERLFRLGRTASTAVRPRPHAVPESAVHQPARSLLFQQLRPSRASLPLVPRTPCVRHRWRRP